MTKFSDLVIYSELVTSFTLFWTVLKLLKHRQLITNAFSSWSHTSNHLQCVQPQAWRVLKEFRLLWAACKVWIPATDMMCISASMESFLGVLRFECRISWFLVVLVECDISGDDGVEIFHARGWCIPRLWAVCGQSWHREVPRSASFE